jgi:hypothetical protein
VPEQQMAVAEQQTAEAEQQKAEAEQQKAEAERREALLTERLKEYEARFGPLPVPPGDRPRS